MPRPMAEKTVRRESVDLKTRGENATEASNRRPQDTATGSRPASCPLMRPKEKAHNSEAASR